MEDLLAIMMLTSGNDAAYLVAETVSPGNLTGFVAMMNAKVTELGCSSTHFVSPGYSNSKEHITTCSDMAKIYKALGIIELYNRIMESPAYTPEGLDEKEFSVTTQNSICNPDSAYYFRYATGGKFSYSKFCGANLMVTTTYRGKTYLFIALRGKYTSEENVFLDARRLATWAYLNLTDRKVIDADNEVASYQALAPWGSYEVTLFAGNSAYKTLPTSFDPSKISYKLTVPETVALPIFEGQGIGSAKIYYDGQKIDDLSLSSSSSEGISLLRDVANLSKSVMKRIVPIEAEAGELTSGADEGSDAPAQAEPQTEPQTDAAPAAASTAAAASSVTEAEG
jgi:D-alanyl-D-alanine carboxypeptidase (penicillin-binding protein 5/6)